MTLTFDTGKAVQRLRGPLEGQAAAEAVVDVIAEAQAESGDDESVAVGTCTPGRSGWRTGC